MKTNLLLATILTTIVSANPPTEKLLFTDTFTKEISSVEFIQKQELENQAKSNSLKTNVIYWTKLDNPYTGPQVLREQNPQPGITTINVSTSGSEELLGENFLQVKGEPGSKSGEGIVQITKAFDVPEGTMTAKVVIIGDAIQNGSGSNIKGVVTQQGTATPQINNINMMGIETPNKWEDTYTFLELAPTAKQLVVSLSTDEKTAINIKSIHVIFHDPLAMPPLESFKPTREEMIEAMQPPKPVS